MGRMEGIAPRPFDQLPALVFGPLAGRPAGDWHAAPPGKWTAAQIAEHLAISLDGSSQRFEERRERAPMVRRPRTTIGRLGAFCIVRLGWFPGGFTAPEGARPGPHPDPAAVERRFRAGHARFLELERLLLPARRHDLFVRHPVLGDLTIEEWMRFHVVHSRHHARQIRARLAG